MQPLLILSSFVWGPPRMAVLANLQAVQKHVPEYFASQTDTGRK